ncbi:MAG: hypothetical protein QXV39_07945 [Candidatus Caldarchaeum sp.]
MMEARRNFWGSFFISPVPGANHEEVLTRLVRVWGGRPVDVVLLPNTVPSTDGKVVYLNKNDDWAKLRVDGQHESAHIRFSDFESYSEAINELSKKWDEEDVKAAMNIVEDIRVESLFRALFPGSAIEFDERYLKFRKHIATLSACEIQEQELLWAKVYCELYKGAFGFETPKPGLEEMGSILAYSPTFGIAVATARDLLVKYGRLAKPSKEDIHVQGKEDAGRKTDESGKSSEKDITKSERDKADEDRNEKRPEKEYNTTETITKPDKEKTHKGLEEALETYREFKKKLTRTLEPGLQSKFGKVSMSRSMLLIELKELLKTITPPGKGDDRVSATFIRETPNLAKILETYAGVTVLDSTRQAAWKKGTDLARRFFIQFMRGIQPKLPASAGKLNIRASLSRYIQGKPPTFTKARPGVGADILILVDTSGSMADRANILRIGVVALVKMLKTMENVRVAVLGFKTLCSPFGSTGPMLDECRLTIEFLKFDSDNLYNLTLLDGSGDNRDDFHISVAADYLNAEARPGAKKLLLVISDGCPAEGVSHFVGEEGVRLTRQAVNAVRKMGIDLLGIGWNLSKAEYEQHKEIYAPHHIWLPKTEQLITQMPKLIQFLKKYSQ